MIVVAATSCVSATKLADRSGTGDAAALAQLLDLATADGKWGFACFEKTPPTCGTEDTSHVAAARELRRIAKSAKPLLSNILSRSAPSSDSQQRTWVRRRHAAAAALLAAGLRAPADEILQWYQTGAKAGTPHHDASLRKLIDLLVTGSSDSVEKDVRTFVSGEPNAALWVVEAMDRLSTDVQRALAAPLWDALGKVNEGHRQRLLVARGQVLRDRALNDQAASGAADEPTGAAISSLWKSAEVANWINRIAWRSPDVAIACTLMRWAIHRALIAAGRRRVSHWHWAQRSSQDFLTLSAFGRVVGERACPKNGDDALIAILTDDRIPGTFDVPLDAMVTAIKPSGLRDITHIEVERLIRQAGFHR